MTQLIVDVVIYRYTGLMFCSITVLFGLVFGGGEEGGGVFLEGGLEEEA